jgi:hypothetical protein
MTRFLGDRVSVSRKDMGLKTPAGESDRLSGTCEAYCPSTRSFLVVFDEPYEPALLVRKPTFRGKPEAPLQGLAVALLGTEDFLTYEERTFPCR